MSGINERIRALCAAFDRTESPEILREIRELEFQKRKAEDDAERERQQARKTREAEVASTNWYAAVDTRIRTHFKAGRGPLSMRGSMSEGSNGGSTNGGMC